MTNADGDLTLALLLIGGALCNDAMVEGDETDASNPGTAVGDPTETALVYAAARTGIWKAQLERQFPRAAEVPFESQRKRMTTIHHVPAGSIPWVNALRSLWRRDSTAAPLTYIAFTKGGVDQLIGVSRDVLVGQTCERLGREWTSRIMRANDGLARDGMRVLGVGLRLFDRLPDDRSYQSIEKELTFVGLVGILDPPRLEAREAVATCIAAGIRPIMITGDHPLTAGYVARALGIATGDRILTGAELEALKPGELADAVDDVSVFARVSPEHKLQIVDALRQQGEVVAMTGDGVNDAPALKRAHIGVAMGITGTDVSKEAADMVLLDDNFATIVAAVEEGRVIYDNIRKFVKYLSDHQLQRALADVGGTIPRDAAAAAAVADSLDQPGDGRSRGADPWRRACRARRDATSAVPAERKHLRAWARVACDLGGHRHGGADAGRRLLVLACGG